MIFVDETEPVNDYKYAYSNCQGDVEYVELGTSTHVVSFGNAGGGHDDVMTEIWAEDIPKMILALEAAYAQYMKCKTGE